MDPNLQILFWHMCQKIRKQMTHILLKIDNQPHEDLFQRILVFYVSEYKNRRCGMIVHETATHRVTVEF